jgi:hypothetical protein
MGGRANVGACGSSPPATASTTRIDASQPKFRTSGASSQNLDQRRFSGNADSDGPLYFFERRESRSRSGRRVPVFGVLLCSQQPRTDARRDAEGRCRNHQGHCRCRRGRRASQAASGRRSRKSPHAGSSGIEPAHLGIEPLARAFARAANARAGKQFADWWFSRACTLRRTSSIFVGAQHCCALSRKDVNFNFGPLNRASADGLAIPLAL